MLTSGSRLPEARLLNQAPLQGSHYDSVATSKDVPILTVPRPPFSCFPLTTTSRDNSLLHKALGRKGSTPLSLLEKRLEAGERETWRGM